MKPPGARPGDFQPRNSPQFRAFSVIAGVSFHGRIPLRRDTASSFLKNLIFRNLQKNPVNLSIFIEFFGNYYLHFARSAPRPGGGSIPASSTPSTA